MYTILYEQSLINLVQVLAKSLNIPFWIFLYLFYVSKYSHSFLYIFKIFRINWIAIIFLTTVGFLYGRFRFGKGGNMIKIYELPSLSSRSNR